MCWYSHLLPVRTVPVVKVQGARRSGGWGGGSAYCAAPNLCDGSRRREEGRTSEGGVTEHSRCIQVVYFSRRILPPVQGASIVNRFSASFHEYDPFMFRCVAVVAVRSTRVYPKWGKKMKQTDVSSHPPTENGKQDFF